jgi:hypothetical protein
MTNKEYIIDLHHDVKKFLKVHMELREEFWKKANLLRKGETARLNIKPLQ